MIYKSIIQELEAVAIPENVPFLQKFFKTFPGEYAEGDKFVGVRVPEQRAIAKRHFKDCSLDDIQKLLTSPYHEHRLTALIILILQYPKKKKLEEKKELFDFYIEHIPFINNWDLVDTSTHKIVAPYLHLTDNFEYLFDLSNDGNMWAKRIAVVSLMYFWKHNFTEKGLELILHNLEHPHDLMHKANGWMLRELSKYDEESMLNFIFLHYEKMPRTTLRYAIEKIKEPFRTNILKGNF